MMQNCAQECSKFFYLCCRKLEKFTHVQGVHLTKTLRLQSFRPHHATAASEALRPRLRLRFSDISNKILDSDISSCGSNGAAAAAAQNPCRRAGSVQNIDFSVSSLEKKVGAFSEQPESEFLLQNYELILRAV